MVRASCCWLWVRAPLTRPLTHLCVCYTAYVFAFGVKVVVSGGGPSRMTCLQQLFLSLFFSPIAPVVVMDLCRAVWLLLHR